LLGAHVTKVVLETAKEGGLQVATAVEFIANAKSFCAKATREVILTAGTSCGVVDAKYILSFARHVPYSSASRALRYRQPRNIEQGRYPGQGRPPTSWGKSYGVSLVCTTNRSYSLQADFRTIWL
jgi:hypothetical protein